MTAEQPTGDLIPSVRIGQYKAGELPGVAVVTCPALNVGAVKTEENKPAQVKAPAAMKGRNMKMQVQ
jgi:hypothetical protein